MKGRPCKFCSAMRCVCVAVRMVHLVAAEQRAGEEVIERARELVMLAKVRAGERLDGLVRLELALAGYDAAVVERAAGVL